jgi:hypothetical protein
MLRRDPPRECTASKRFTELSMGVIDFARVNDQIGEPKGKMSSGLDLRKRKPPMVAHSLEFDNCSSSEPQGQALGHLKSLVPRHFSLHLQCGTVDSSNTARA